MNYIDDVRKKVMELGQLIDAPQNKLYIFDIERNDGGYHLELHGDEYHYIRIIIIYYLLL